MAIINGIPLINGQSYTWGDIVCLVAGVPVTGITAIDYEDNQEVKNNYGAGRYPVSRGKGRITCTAKITLEMDEVLAIQGRAINGRLQDIAPFDVQVSYIPGNGRIVHDIVRDCQFNTNKRTWKEGDTNQPVELELIVSKISWGK
ncbi:MAG: hypothetical protein ACRC9X_05190 [Bacteroidales bacterium]